MFKVIGVGNLFSNHLCDFLLCQFRNALCRATSTKPHRVRGATGTWGTLIDSHKLEFVIVEIVIWGHGDC